MAADQTKPADAVRPAADGPSGTAAGETGSAAKAAKAAKPAKPAKAAKPGKPAKPGAGGPSDLDDMKAKFRAALDRKRGEHAGSNAEGAQDTSKVHGAHGPAASRRSFRRKSGS